MEMLRRLMRIRHFEEAVIKLVEGAEIVGGAHSYIGEEAVAVENISDRAAAYAIPGVLVDGQDVVSMHEAVTQAAVTQAVERARSGQGPSLVEGRTYRWRGHAESRGNPAEPRAQSGIDRGPAHDPIAYFASFASFASFAAQVTPRSIATAGQLQEIDNEISAKSPQPWTKPSPPPKPARRPKGFAPPTCPFRIVRSWSGSVCPIRTTSSRG